MLCYGCGRNHNFPGSSVLHVRGIALFMEVMFFARDRKRHFYGSYVLHVIGAPILAEVIIRIWSEVKRFVFLSR